MAHAPHLGLASVEFFVQGIRCIRVYYRSSDDTTIRESCYQQDIGWFVRGDGIVTRKAKKNSPLTALRVCFPEEKIIIIVVYLDPLNHIHQCLAPLKLEAPWVETLLFTFKPGPLNILPESQLALVRRDNEEEFVLFYQGEGDDQTNFPLCGVKWIYSGAGETAFIFGRVASDAAVGTRMSAFVDNFTNNVALYYQCTDGSLQELLSEGSSHWTESHPIQEQYKLIANAPITAILRKTRPSHYQIDIFTVITDNRDAISQFTYKHPKWMHPISTFISCQDRSDITSCQNVGPNTTSHSPVCLFYETENGSINMTPIPADTSAASRAMAVDIPLPTGIPISIDGPVQLRDTATTPKSSDTSYHNNSTTSDTENTDNLLGHAPVEVRRVDSAKEKSKAASSKATTSREQPASITRSNSLRRRQSMQILELERKIDELVVENRLLLEERVQSEKSLSFSSVSAKDSSRPREALQQLEIDFPGFSRASSDSLAGGFGLTSRHAKGLDTQRLQNNPGEAKFGKIKAPQSSSTVKAQIIWRALYLVAVKDIRILEYSKCGSMLMTIDTNSRYIKIWDVALLMAASNSSDRESALICSCEASMEVVAAEFSFDNESLWIVLEKGGQPYLRSWRFKTDRSFTMIPNIILGGQLLATNCNGQFLALSMELGLAIFDFDTVDMIEYEQRLTSAVFSPTNSHIIAAGYAGGTVIIYNCGEQVSKFRVGKTRFPVITMAFSPNGEMLVVKAQFEELGIWKWSTGECLASVFPAPGLRRRACPFVKFTIDGRFIVASFSDVRKGNVLVFDLDLDTVADFPTGEHCNMDFSPDGKWLAMVSEDYKLEIRELSDK